MGGFGSGPGQLNQPSGLALDADGNLIVGDTHNNRVQKLSPDGAVPGVLGRRRAAAPASSTCRGAWPWTVGATSTWRTGATTASRSSGRTAQPLAIYGADGPAEARLKRPSGVAVDDDGLVYVADWGNNLVKIYGPGGALVATLEGDADLSPWAVEYLAADAATAALRGRGGASGAGAAVLGADRHQAGRRGRLYVVESCRHRMQVYQK